MTIHVERCSAKRNYTLFAAALLMWVLGCGQNPPQREVIRPVKAMKVLDVAQFRERTFPGRAKAAQEVELSFRVSGPLITRSVDVGDEVKQGDVVARIDPRDFEVNLRNVQGQLGSAKAALQRAQSDYARVLRLFKKDPGATSQTAIDIAREERDRARANIQSLEAAVSAAEDQLRYT